MFGPFAINKLREAVAKLMPLYGILDCGSAAT
jgi:hypothetical protein